MGDGREHRLGTGNAQLAGCLDLQQAHHAVFRVQRKAARAQAHAEGGAVQLQSQRAGEAGVAVGQHQQACGDFLRSRPGLHHVTVVDRQAHHADAALLELGEVRRIAGQVLVRAGRGECARYAEQQRFSSGEQGGGLGRADVAVDDLDGGIGNRVAGLDAHAGLGGRENLTMLVAPRRAVALNRSTQHLFCVSGGD